MSINRQRILWAAFLLATLLTRLVDSMLWRAKWQFSALEVLGTISIILGVAIVAPKGRTARSVLLVFLALVVGQWWLIVEITVRIIWGIGGFAP